MSAHFKCTSFPYPLSVSRVPWLQRSYCPMELAIFLPNPSQQIDQADPKNPAKERRHLHPRPSDQGRVSSPRYVYPITSNHVGYVNPLNTTLEFDVTLNTYGTVGNDIVRFQNNVRLSVDTNPCRSNPSFPGSDCCTDPPQSKVCLSNKN